MDDSGRNAKPLASRLSAPQLHPWSQLSETAKSQRPAVMDQGSARDGREIGRIAENRPPGPPMIN